MLKKQSLYESDSRIDSGAETLSIGSLAFVFLRLLVRTSKKICAVLMLMACLGTAAWAATPTIDFPLSGATLSGDKQTFLLNSRGLPVTSWWVHAGPSRGSSAYVNSGLLGAGVHHEFSGFPEDASTVHVRLWYRQLSFLFPRSSVWQFKDYTFSAQSPSTPKFLTPNSFSENLTGLATRFVWNDNNFGADSYRVGIGFFPGFEFAYWSWDNLYHSGAIAHNPTRQRYNTVVADGLIRLVNQIPGYTEYLYLGLYAKRPGEDYVLVEHQVVKPYNASTVPSIASPVSETTLASTSATFQWTNNGMAISRYWLYVGASLGGKEYYDSGNLGGISSHTVSVLPNDGSEIYVRLWYYDGTRWRFSDEQFKASGVGPQIVDPIPGSILDYSEDISWTDNGVGVTQWQLTAGHSPGGREYFNSGNLGSATSVTASVSAPDSGLSYNMRLWFKTGSDSFWRHTDFSYGTID